MVRQFKVTKTYHREPYPAISPLRPELSQEGRTILITGGTSGIGYYIAKAFVLARAHKVIILGRRADVTANAAATLLEEAKMQSLGASSTQVVGLVCDVGSATDVSALWGRLAGEGTHIDVLILNAAAVAPAVPLLEVGTTRLWGTDYEVNVRSLLDMAERFYHQPGEDAKKFLIHVSTQAIHDFAAASMYPGYGLTKNAGALAMQLIAQDVPVEKMQVLSYHPGAIFTDAARKAGFGEDSMAWDDPVLPGHYAVWAATPEAAFLHGRFVWAHWDVDELKSGELRKQVDEDPNFLRIGIKGLA
ncbi:NAD(P)-binding protein [Hypomontagnella monticulosa]|nr:NAD(P)-binding protein [Hypomontagnella monticulosa]